MMTKFYVDDRLYDAASPEELVAMMHEMSFAPAEDDAAWMRQTAERVTVQSGKTIRCDKPENFVDDLISIGFIKPQGEPK